MPRIRAIVFDVGGTLLYPAVPVGETYAKYARKSGVKLSPEATETAFREVEAGRGKVDHRQGVSRTRRF
jgi:FMN phosphatase YigB (HAD superfamily)